MASGDTRDRLMDAALATLRDHGASGLSARTVGAAAGVNQALIFYHFDSLTGLVVAACRRDSLAAVDTYREQFAQVTTLRDLLALGRQLHARQEALGRVKVMAQLLAAGQNDPDLAAAARDALRLWQVEIAATLTRVLAGSPLVEVVDIDGLAGSVSASFIGLELFVTVDPAAGERAFDALDRLGALAAVLDDLGPVERRLVRRALGRTV